MNVTLINPDNPEHMEFMLDLAQACREDFLDDFDNDEIVVLHGYANSLKNGRTTGFIADIDGVKAGIVWVDVDSKKIGYLHVGLLPEYRQGANALSLIREFVDFCFNTLNLRKVVGNVPTRNTVIEKLLRRIHFTKEGLDMEATVVNGRPENHVVLSLTKNRYLENKHGIQK